ncbi:MAG: chain-length determining protein [Clostridiaceae bacterium]|mgnify:CR=1 FL=1|nr:chain-length determining protein [Clostridiaceae bacterium]
MDTKEYEIDLKHLLGIILHKLWIIVLFTILAVAASGFLSFYVLTPIYETSTTLIVNKPAESISAIQYNDVLLSQKLAKTYGEIIKSRTVLSRVIENLSLNYTVGEFREKISVLSVNDTEIIEIKVTDENPELAALIANELANVFMGEVTRILKADNVQVIDQALVPQFPVKPRPMFNMAVAGVLGAMLGLGIILVREYFDDTIKTTEDIERYLQLPVLGTIPDTEKM